MKHILTAYSILLFLIPAYPAFAQDGDAEPGVEETLPQEGTQGPEQSASEPAIVPEQPYKYYYWPEENLDNFGLSTMGQGQGGSTLGRNVQRKSNIDVNPPKESPKSEEDTGGDTEGANGDTDLFPPVETGGDNAATEIEKEMPQAGPKESKFYEWVDEKGNIHITNNIGDVPLEYQEEIYGRKSSSQAE